MKRKWSGLALAVVMALLLAGCQSSLNWDSIYPDNQWGGGLIPVSELMDYAEYTAPQISADGTKVLYRHMTESSDSVMIKDWETGVEMEVPWPQVNGNPSFGWAPDGETVLFFVDNNGDENYGLYTTNTRTGQSATILPGGDNNCYYVSDNPADTKTIYIQLLNEQTSRYDLYLCNYETGDMTLVLTNPGDITNYIFDYDGNLRLVATIDEQAGIHTWEKDPNATGTTFNKTDWHALTDLAWTYEDADTSGVLSFMQDNNRVLYNDSSKSDTSALYTYDLATNTSELVYEDPDYDINGSWTDLALDKVTAVNVYADKIEWHVLDDSFQADYDALSAVQEGEFDIFDSSDEDAYWLVAYMSDTSEADYYVYDMETNEATFLYNARAEVGEMNLASVEPFSYTASDGLDIHGYVTFPVDSEKKNLPTVVLVHGGPWVRDTWEYNSEVQFLANRGYVVLQVNYRGSSGYGKSFMLAGDKEWGKKMHQDILDAVSYAVDQGWTDPDRVGIYGASYGGYEALVSAAFSSDVFQCAVDAFGPSSLLTFIKSIPPQWSVEYQDLIRSVGDPDTEAEDMKTRSPLYFADDIAIPMLIAQGENDVRVPQSESDQMVAALKEAGVPVTYLLFPNTGHGFNSMEARVQFYSSMESFFAEHLGGLSSEE
jgi:dipeptidyl aminopeptidase/acylaminoacyl peptidase